MQAKLRDPKEIDEDETKKLKFFLKFIGALSSKQLETLSPQMQLGIMKYKKSTGMMSNIKQIFSMNNSSSTLVSK